MASSVRRTRVLWLAGFIFSAATVHSFFYNRTGPASPELMSASVELEVQVRSTAAAILGPDAGGLRMDTYTGAALNTTESPATTKPNGLVDFFNGSKSVMAYGRANVGAVMAVQDAAPDATKPKRGSVDRTTLGQLGGVTESVPEYSPTRSSGVQPALRSLRPPARSEGLTRTVTSMQVPKLEPQTALGALTVSIRPLARPDVLLVAVTRVQQPESEAEFPVVQSDLTRALVLAPRQEVTEVTPQETTPPRRGRDLSGRRLRTIVGLFETSSRRWALVESEGGRMIILEPGDVIGDGIVSSISNGTLVISVDAAFKEYYAGDRL